MGLVAITNRSIEGTYTIEGKTKHVTIRFHQTHWLRRLIESGERKEGTMVVGWLRGPDNSSDYTGFAFAIPDGRGGYRFYPWHKVDQGKYAHQIWSAKYILHLFKTDPVGLQDRRYAYAMMSGNCSRCGRTLTVPASINRGLGPECAKLV